MLCDTGTPVGPTTIFGHTFLHSSLRSSITSHVIFVAVAGHRPWPIDNIDVEELVSISELLALLGCCCCCSFNIYDTAELTSVPSSSVIHSYENDTYLGGGEEWALDIWTKCATQLSVSQVDVKLLWVCSIFRLTKIRNSWSASSVHHFIYLSLCLWPKHDHQTPLAIPPYSKLFKRSVSQTVEH